MTEHKVCLSINGTQSVKLKKNNKKLTIKFKNAFQEIQVPYKIYSDFEYILKSAGSFEGSWSKNIKITCFVVLLTNLFDRFSKPIVLYRGENAAYKYIEAILKECEYCKKVMNKHFNKNLIMN